MPPKPISFSSNDFLSKSETKKAAKKRKSAEKEKPATKKAKKTVASDETRGHMTIFCKSKTSVQKDLETKKEKNKDAVETAAAKSLSVSIKEGETLLVIDNAVVNSSLLTEQEQKQLDAKKAWAKKKYGEEPCIFKLQWRDRDGATLVGMTVTKTSFTLTSKLTEAQTFSVSNAIWLASRESVANIALNEIDGKSDLLAIVPDYKGVVRITLDGEVSGTFGLALK